MYSRSILTLMSLIQILILSMDCASYIPLWKTQLIHFKRWQGHYLYNNTPHTCSVVVHSVQKDDTGGAVISFQDDKARLTMTVFSLDNIRIVFKEETVYEVNDRFYDKFQFVMELFKYGKIHAFLGNITVPKSNFSTIRLQPEGSWYKSKTYSSSLSVGVAVGVSLSLFVICVVIGVLILRWAIKKGYLRHMAMSYKSFRNPEAGGVESLDPPPVSFSSSQQDVNQGEIQVHI